MTAVLSNSVFTGANAGTEHTGQSAITLVAADALTGGDVLPGTVSYERWIALRVDTVPATGVTNFSIKNSGVLPVGVTIKFGVTDTPATPKNTASTIATTTLTDGRTFIFDTNTYDTAGETTRFLVLQEVVSASAASGAISPQSLVLGWQES